MPDPTPAWFTTTDSRAVKVRIRVEIETTDHRLLHRSEYSEIAPAATAGVLRLVFAAWHASTGKTSEIARMAFSGLCYKALGVYEGAQGIAALARSNSADA